MKAAGFIDENKKATRRIYDLRHSYATMSLAAGVSLFSLSRRMGTSLEMIDQTCGHLRRVRQLEGEESPAVQED